MKGQNRFISILLKYLGNDIISEIDNYVLDLPNRKFNPLENDTADTVNNFLSQLSSDELMIIRSYTGYQFKNINAHLRHNWNYEENGLLTPEIEQKYNDLSEKICTIAAKFPSLNTDFITYRGVDISAFKEYGIDTLYDLKDMQGKYLYEKGFTSTSTKRENSFFNRTLETGKNYNIEIQYLIPKESSDGILLAGQELSFSPGQNEYLINKDSLSRVINVSVNKELNQAQLTVALIPKKLWTMEEQKEDENKQRTN